MSEPTRPVWVDNHCHLQPDDASALVAEAVTEQVVAVVCVGTDLPSSIACLELARQHPSVWATAGVHPHDASGGIDGLRDVVGAGQDDGRLVAIGEAGFDFHYEHSPRSAQEKVFAAQVELANEIDLPLVIHTREAWDETFDLLDREGTPRRTVFHCFTGGPSEAAGALARGAMLSVSGIVTFPSARELREAVAATPLGRLMVETDSPYLAPVPHRGRPNRPALVPFVGAEVARIHDVSVAEVASATTANATAFYGIDLGWT